jgi:hypothetical protein
MRLGDLLTLRDKLWSQVKEVPGVITVGIGSQERHAALIVFIDETTVQKDDLPVEYFDVPIVLRPAGRASSQGV